MPRACRYLSLDTRHPWEREPRTPDLRVSELSAHSHLSNFGLGAAGGRGLWTSWPSCSTYGQGLARPVLCGLWVGHGLWTGWPSRSPFGQMLGASTLKAVDGLARPLLCGLWMGGAQGGRMLKGPVVDPTMHARHVHGAATDHEWLQKPGPAVLL